MHTLPIVIAVAWAAILVPLRVFLKPSIPQERINRGTPVKLYSSDTFKST